MTTPESTGEPDEQLAQLKVENAHLLDELEMAYRQMEGALSVAHREREMAYDELRQRNEELQHRLAELEKAHRQLQEAQQMLLRAERMSAMGTMAAALVHELNSPLTVIAARVEMMLMDAEGGDKAEYEAIMKSVWQLRDLVRNTLTFARRQHAQPHLIDLGEVVDQVQNLMTPMTKNVRMETARVDGLPQVLADPSQVEQVLTSFIINALDAMSGTSDAHLRITTGVERPAELVCREEEMGRVAVLALADDPEFPQSPAAYVEVRDNGSGMAADAMDEIFEAFFTTKAAGKGTGLGLAISRGIAETHHGDILVASKPGAGTSISLLLPVPAESQG